MKIAIVFGGISYEHEISIVSSIALKDVLKNDLIYIFLDEQKDFYHIPNSNMQTSTFSTKEYKKYDKLTLNKQTFSKKTFICTKKIEFDIVLNLVHGGYGEDGVLASLFDFFDIRFIGPRVEACSISINKFLTKSYSNSLGINVLDYKIYNKSKSDEINIKNYPVIIKPLKLGSSIGVSIVNKKDDLQYALDSAFEFDNDILIEPFINNIKEYNLAGCKIDDEFIFSIIEEPKKNNFLDFDKKYLDFSSTKKVSPATISKQIENQLKNNFKKIYNTIFEGSIIRCDFFVLDDTVYLNEINSIPGSMANYLFEDFNDLINRLCLNLPRQESINIRYDYISKINSNK